MNSNVGRPEVGQWYARLDKGEVFRVVGYDDRSRTIEIQSFDGDIDEIAEDTWPTLALERSEAPEDWTGPLDEVETDDLGYSETAMTTADWKSPLQPLRTEGEAWEDAVADDERDALGEGTPTEEISSDLPETDEKEAP
jgi:hypothetical protein